MFLFGLLVGATSGVVLTLLAPMVPALVKKLQSLLTKEE